MACNKNAVAVIFTLALLLVAYGAEAYVCRETNKHYHGPCKSHMNCNSDCVANGFQGGHCGKKVIIGKTPCKCTKPCGPGGGGSTPPEEGPPAPPSRTRKMAN